MYSLTTFKQLKDGDKFIIPGVSAVKYTKTNSMVLGANTEVLKIEEVVEGGI